AANPALTVSNVLAGDGGNYWVTVSNKFGMVTSTVATLTVLFPPGITTQPTNQSVVLSNNATFALSATGAATLVYQWRKGNVNLTNGPSVSGATTATLTIFSVRTNDAGAYDAIVTNTYGSLTSAVAALTVVSP